MAIPIDPTDVTTSPWRNRNSCLPTRLTFSCFWWTDGRIRGSTGRDGGDPPTMPAGH